MSDEQKAVWIPKAERFEIFGSYCQTELGHGSNVRGIETTATFDEGNDEFVINSPTISSAKYWIGATGVWATHGIVVARLIIRGKDYGNHLFLTQLRDLDTQELMHGVEIHELGPKAFQGMLGTDNGAMRFHGVRIPGNQMLARNAQVRRDGTYVKPKNEKHSYGSMVTVRALMAEITGHDLLKAAVLAWHYTRFRKQFRKSGEAEEETTVFDYASVRYRLLPLLAQATTLILVGQNIGRAYEEYTKTMLEMGDTSDLEDLHLQTVGAKVYSTEITGKGVETCRIACGGHGYSALSGFGRMYAHSINAVTYEGDNYVIGQQVPRAVLKHWRKYVTPALTELLIAASTNTRDSKTESSLPSLSYLSLLRSSTPPSPPAGSDLTTPEAWLKSSVQSHAMSTRLAQLVRQHISDTESGIDTSYSSHALTMAHGDFVYFSSLQDLLDRLEKQLSKPAFLDAIKKMSNVFALGVLYQPHHPSLSYALASSLPADSSVAAISALKTAYDNTLKDFADSAAAEQLVDAWGLTEYELDSALARTDKTPYEALWEGAKNSEMSGDGLKDMRPFMVETRNTWRDVEEQKSRAKL